jgi:hypothetical protein
MRGDASKPLASIARSANPATHCAIASSKNHDFVSDRAHSSVCSRAAHRQTRIGGSGRARRERICESSVCSGATHGSLKNDHHAPSEQSRVVFSIFDDCSVRARRVFTAGTQTPPGAG